MYHARVISEEYLRWTWNEVYITISWDAANWCARNSCEKRYSMLLLSVSDYRCLEFRYNLVFHYHQLPHGA